MQVDAKFEIGEKVYYFDNFLAKIIQGEIEHIEALIYSDRTIMAYYIKPIIKEQEFDEENPFLTFLRSMQFTPIRVQENVIFRNREDVLNFAIKITDDI